MKLIVGLGNPGKEYEKTRHNVGFIILDSYLKEEKWKEKFNALYLEKNINGEKVIFIKPLTFMNLSGEAVIKFVNYYDIDTCDILVIHDDLDISFGNFKLKVNSSDGGHNGIKSIISQLKSNGFSRLKIGVSHDRSIDTKDYVLGEFNKVERETLSNNQSLFEKIIESFIKYGIDKTMAYYNGQNMR